MARWNHPKCITAPTSSLHYGSKNDSQRLLINDTEKSTLEKLGGAEKIQYHLLQKTSCMQKMWSGASKWCP